ncbi:MAG TPA: hypothetical protein VFL13_01525 [Candidatus Baltobacteraceae bacterium]|nr:hypothetical protein [Candidatus Baltobacteraceae bacterium]
MSPPFRRWFDSSDDVFRKALIIGLFVFAGGTYMYVWCEIFTPRWYDGPLSRRYGLLPRQSLGDLLTTLDV